MLIGNNSFLGTLFSAKAAKLPCAKNDNIADPPFFFSQRQVEQLNDVLMPYLRRGHVTNIEYKRGYQSGVILAKDSRQREDVVLCLTVHQEPGSPHKFTANAAGLKLNLETINFNEVMSHARYALGALFPETPRGKASLSLV